MLWTVEKLEAQHANRRRILPIAHACDGKGLHIPAPPLLLLTCDFHALGRPQLLVVPGTVVLSVNFGGRSREHINTLPGSSLH